MKTKERGNFDFKLDADNLIILRWNDNSIVTMVSNVRGIYPVQKANRWSREEKKMLDVPQPAVIKVYNRYIGRGGGGVGLGGGGGGWRTDRMDQNVAAYRVQLSIEEMVVVDFLGV